MLVTRITLFIFLLLTLPGCNQNSHKQQAKALLSDASKLIEQDTDVSRQLANEVATTFTAQHRAQFPANREFIQTHAANIIKLLDQSTSLNNRAAEKYEQAARLIRDERQHLGMSRFADGFRKNVELNEILKSVMQSVSDESVVDELTLNERFAQSHGLIEQKRRERDESFEEAKQLLGL